MLPWVGAEMLFLFFREMHCISSPIRKKLASVIPKRKVRQMMLKGDPSMVVYARLKSLFFLWSQVILYVHVSASRHYFLPLFIRSSVFREMSFMRQAATFSWYICCSYSAPCLYQIFCFRDGCHPCTILLLLLDTFIIYGSHPMSHLHIIYVSHSFIAYTLHLFIASCIALLLCSCVGLSLHSYTRHSPPWSFLLMRRVHLSDSSLIIYQPSGLEPPLSLFPFDIYQVPWLLARVLRDDLGEWASRCTDSSMLAPTVAA